MADLFEDSAIARVTPEQRIKDLEEENNRLKRDAFVVGCRLAELRKKLAKTQDQLVHAKHQNQQQVGALAIARRTARILELMLLSNPMIAVNFADRLRIVTEAEDEDFATILAELQAINRDTVWVFCDFTPLNPQKKHRRRRVAEKK